MEEFEKIVENVLQKSAKPKAFSETEKEFRQELKGLLKRYGADMEIGEDRRGYRDHIEVYIPSKYDGDHNNTAEGGTVDLGGYVSGD